MWRLIPPPGASSPLYLSLLAEKLREEETTAAKLSYLLFQKEQVVTARIKAMQFIHLIFSFTP